MPAALRLMRLGKRKTPFYRIVVVDKRKKRDGKYIDNIGSYNPLTEPAEIKLDKAKFESWIQKGAEISEGLYKLLKYKSKIQSSNVKRD